ncbi:MAG: hypothetical protein SV775_15195 [Thermodesulfobacteriota bacterium]|nr:hypothetical protein [Thermodesulfobacteriota bacterium]
MKDREEELTGSIAELNRPIVGKVKGRLEFGAKGKKITSSGEGYRVREAPACYNAFREPKKRI